MDCYLVYNQPSKNILALKGENKNHPTAVKMADGWLRNYL
jgi:hypothetical protein